MVTGVYTISFTTTDTDTGDTWQTTGTLYMCDILGFDGSLPIFSDNVLYHTSQTTQIMKASEDDHWAYQASVVNICNMRTDFGFYDTDGNKVSIRYAPDGSYGMT